MQIDDNFEKARALRRDGDIHATPATPADLILPSNPMALHLPVATSHLGEIKTKLSL
jgi:hypothetical protein